MKSKKLIFLILIPIALTLFFIVKFTLPVVKDYFDLKKDIKKETIAIKNLEKSIKTLKANKSLENELEKLNLELFGFDIEFPSEFKDEILLIDLEMFADEATNKIVELQSSNEKEIKIVNPDEEENKTKRRSRRSRRSKQEEVIPPLEITEKSFSINTVAYYSQIIDFVGFLENYQRKININGISAKVFNEDKDNPNPRIELQIDGSTYKSKINKLQNNDEKEKENEA